MVLFGLPLGINTISKLIVAWCHSSVENIATGQTTKNITLPITMNIYGQCVTSGTRILNLNMTAFNYDFEISSSNFVVGFYNGTSSKQSTNVFIVAIGK